MEVDYHSILVSYDVTSLFTTVPVDETIQILAEKEVKDKLWLRSNIYFASVSENLFACASNKLLLVSITCRRPADSRKTQAQPAGWFPLPVGGEKIHFTAG